MGVPYFTERIIGKNNFDTIRLLWGFMDFGGTIVRRNFTSRIVGSILSVLYTQVKRVSQHSAESRGFFPGTPVSSHREC